MATDIKDINALSSNETLVHAIMGEDTIHPTNREQVAAQDLRRIMKEGNPREGTEMLASRGLNSMEDMQVAIDANISMKDVVAAKGKRVREPGSDEELRYNEALGNARLANELLIKGYDQMEDHDKELARDRVKAAVESYWVDAATTFSGLSEDKIDRMVETFLRDPKFSRKMSELFVKLQKERIPQVPSELQQKFREAEENFNTINAEYERVSDELAEARDLKDKFRDGEEKAEELKDLGRLSDAETALERAKENLEQAQAEERDLRAVLSKIERWEDAVRNGHTVSADAQAVIAMKGTYERQLAAKENSVKSLKGTETKARRKVEDIKSLEELKQKTINDVRRLSEQEAALGREKTKAQTKMYLSQADLNRAQEEHKQAELKFIKELENLYAQSTENIIDVQLERAQQKREDLLKEIGEEGFAMKIRDRWNVTEKGKLKLNKERIQSDYKDLLDVKGGPKELVVKILMSEPNLMTEAQAREYLFQNSDKAKELQREATMQLMSKVLQKGSGIKPNEEHLRIIQESDWGEDLIDDAMRKNTENDAEAKRMKEMGLLDTGKWKEGMIKNLPKAVLSILMLVLAGALSWDALATLNVIPGIGKTIEDIRD